MPTWTSCWGLRKPDYPDFLALSKALLACCRSRAPRAMDVRGLREIAHGVLLIRIPDYLQVPVWVGVTPTF